MKEMSYGDEARTVDGRAARHDRKEREQRSSLRRINKNDRFNLHFVLITVVVFVGGGGGSAIKIDRSVTIGVGRRRPRPSEGRSLESSKILGSLFSSRLSDPVCRGEEKTVSFPKARRYFRSDILQFRASWPQRKSKCRGRGHQYRL